MCVSPGGYVANSLAIMTDALHMLADLIGILVSLLALWLSAKPPTAKFTFGLHRLGTSGCPISDPPAVRLLSLLWFMRKRLKTGVLGGDVGGSCLERKCVVSSVPRASSTSSLISDALLKWLEHDLVRVKVCS